MDVGNNGSWFLVLGSWFGVQASATKHHPYLVYNFKLPPRSFAAQPRGGLACKSFANLFALRILRKTRFTSEFPRGAAARGLRGESCLVPAVATKHQAPSTKNHKPNTRHLARRRAAFTLVEMLVVIVIIAILLAMGSSAYVQAINHAKRGRAETQLRELTKAWNAYYLTYHKWPTSNPNLNNQTSLPMTYNNLMPLFAVLDNGSANPSANPHNTNAIPFLSIKIKSGETYCDPWGHPYKITFSDDATSNDRQDVALRITVGFPNRDRYR